MVGVLVDDDGILKDVGGRCVENDYVVVCVKLSD